MDYFSDENGNAVHASTYGLPESFPMESTITITFEEADNGKTRLTLHYDSIEGIEGMMLDNMTMGWNQTLDKLEASLRQN